ncbi:hypothetical protein ONZ45_g10813 [Pleurotus djamor]|nr:hypothetical protein ONZ45_g10813 [Pleurotus djamor]
MTRRHKPTGLPRVKVTPTKRKAILIYCDQLDMSFNAIANEPPEFKDTAADHTTISKNYHLAKEHGCYHHQSKQGRPRAFSEAEMDYAVEQIDTGNATDAADLRRKYFPDAIPRTLRHALVRRDRRGYVRRKKVVLSAQDFQKRLEFAQKYSFWAESANWTNSNVIFSDESKFNIGGSDGLRWCRRPRGRDQLRETTVSQRERRGLGRHSVMVWGCMSRRGVGRLHRIEGRMNRFGYMDVLRESLLPTIEEHGFSGTDWTFQQDNDRKHTANDTKQWLREHTIKTLDWPAHSPDISVIENGWAMLEYLVERHTHPPPKNEEELWKALKDVWYSRHFNDYIIKVYESFPSRLKSLLETNGRWTKY